MARILDGRKIAAEINKNILRRTEKMLSEGHRPLLVSVSVGESEDARIYVNMQEKVADSVGIAFRRINFSSSISSEQFSSEIKKLSEDDEVTSVIIQKPLPEGLQHDRLIGILHPDKDAEGLHPCNLGRILRKEADILPCTPGAVMKILTESKETLYGKRAVVVGHSAIVGKPLSLMLLNEMVTTSVCHIATDRSGHLKSYTREADILVVAVGKPAFMKADMIKPGAIVIDVGINSVEGGIVGDVDFQGSKDVAGAMTPVPGGVGPVTVSILMRNVLRAFVRKTGALR